MGSYKKPSAILEELGITDPGDIDIEAISQHCGATVAYAPLSGCEARLLGHGEKAIITVREDAPRGRQRFSAAHELGHWMRDRNKVAYACGAAIFKTQWSTERDDPERRANRYAAELLLPEGIFRPVTRGKPVTFATARDLANLFETSLTATAIRLVEIGYLPAMAVCSSRDRREWFFRGGDIPLWPLEKLGRDTVAYDLLNDSGIGDPGPTEVCAAGWIDHVDAGQYSIVEDCRRIGPGLILSLLWWEDERQLLDLAEDSEE